MTVSARPDRTVGEVPPQPRPVTRSACDGVIVAGVFTAVWAWWAATAFTGAAAVVVAGVGTAGGAALVIAAVRRRRSAAAGPALFGTLTYRVGVALEVVALLGGQAVLSATQLTPYLPVWVAGVVGVHLLAFGRLLASSFYAAGAALIVAGVVGACLGAAGDGAHHVLAVTGSLAAAALFASGAWRLGAPPFRRVLTG